MNRVAKYTMANDNELLRDYAKDASQSAFAELVSRHLTMVYATALRETGGNADSAQELTQLVFIELSRKASTLVKHPALAGWLYTSVRWLAANNRRAEQRREQRQLEYHAMSETHSNPEDSVGQQIQPVLDDTLHELEEADRSVLILRFFEDRSFKEVGTQLGLTENAARMRVDRALARLHDLLAKRGITSTRSALATFLVTCAVASVPNGLAATISAGAASSAVLSSTTQAKLLKPSLLAKRLLCAGTAAVLILGTLGSIHYIRSHPDVGLKLHRWFMR